MQAGSESAFVSGDASKDPGALHVHMLHQLVPRSLPEANPQGVIEP